MIEIQIDQREIDRQLTRLGRVPRRLSQCVVQALRVTVPEVRKKVIGTLEAEVAVGHRFIRRAVKAVRYSDDGAQFRVFSKNLLLDDYELSPREQTARPGVQSRNWPGFEYKLRKNGKTYHSFGTLTGRDGTGSVPFLAQTQSGNLRVMYRRNKDRSEPGKDVFLAYAPSIQYHAVAPEVEEVARATAMRLFHENLDHIVSVQLGENA